MELELRSVEHQGAHEAGGAQGGRRAPTLVDRVRAPWWPSDANSISIYWLSGRKKSERRNHRVLRYGAAAKP